MDKIANLLGDKFGAVWTKIKFYKEIPSSSNYQTVEGIRFCEAISKARFFPVILRASDVSCTGARYVFGWDSKASQKIISVYCEKRKIPFKVARAILLAVPQLNNPPAAVGLNTDDEPDLVISYLQPEQFMNLLRVFQEDKGKNLSVNLSSITGICGNIAVKTYLKEEISLSFGCEDSRKYGRISPDQVVVGIPYSELRVFVPDLMFKV